MSAALLYPAGSGARWEAFQYQSVATTVREHLSDPSVVRVVTVTVTVVGRTSDGA